MLTQNTLDLDVWKTDPNKSETHNAKKHCIFFPPDAQLQRLFISKTMKKQRWELFVQSIKKQAPVRNNKAINYGVMSTLLWQERKIRVAQYFEILACLYSLLTVLTDLVKSSFDSSERSQWIKTENANLKYKCSANYAIIYMLHARSSNLHDFNQKRTKFLSTTTHVCFDFTPTPNEKHLERLF